MICTRCRTGETTAGDDLLCDTCRVEVSERETLDLPAAEEVEQNVRKHLGQDFQMEGLLGRSSAGAGCPSSTSPGSGISTAR